jgi:uncharacterized protein (DUF488 family)
VGFLSRVANGYADAGGVTMRSAQNPIGLFTIGHSNQSLEAFLDLIAQHAIEVLVDVRSQPYSRYSRHFDQPSLRHAVNQAGRRYAFLGKELGGRPAGDEFYDEEGRALYWRIAETDFFERGIRQLEKGLQSYRLAVVCSEENPLGCHRSLLIARVLEQRGVPVRHIRGDGSTQTEAELQAQRAAQVAPRLQLSLFAPAQQDQPEATWRSIQSVLRREPPRSSSEP